MTQSQLAIYLQHCENVYHQQIFKASQIHF